MKNLFLIEPQATKSDLRVAVESLAIGPAIFFPLPFWIIYVLSNLCVHTHLADLISPYWPQGAGGKSSSTTASKSSEDENLAKGKSEMTSLGAGHACVNKWQRVPVAAPRPV